jgi:glycosyltransferase involved in cell wall biosynthesis
MKILLITLEPIGNRMAGPAIRCLELGKQLGKHFEVSVFSPYKTNDEISFENCNLQLGLNKAELFNLAKQQDILIIQANVLKQYPALSSLNKYLVVDLYDPFLFNIHLQYNEHPPSIASAIFRLMHKLLEKHMISADFSICASERQRDYWIGRFCALGRINPDVHSLDPSLRKLIDVVPFGVPEDPPVSNGSGPRAIFPNIGPNDPILLWAGGVWDWLDPLTVIKAVGKLKDQIPNIRLVFMGRISPNPQVQTMSMSSKAEDLAKQLGLLDKNVFFAPHWISYKDRANFLLEATIGVSAHFDLPETRYSFRTRLLDYFWANLPIITTAGDELATLIENRHAGISIDYQDIDGWTKALSNLLTDQQLLQSYSDGSKSLATHFSWNQAVKPLFNYCKNPYHLPNHKKVTMPNIFERAYSIYHRGGKEMLYKRARQIIKENLR